MNAVEIEEAISLLAEQEFDAASFPYAFLEAFGNKATTIKRLHLVWIATVCGKLKTDFRYSNTMGWNTFPVPKLTEKI